MDSRVTQAVAAMEEGLGRALTLDEIAASVNLSVSRFAHLFKQHTGVPPARYLHELRLARARLLLERTFLSVKQVMAAVGLNDPSHFSRDFRRCHGVSPSALRQRGWAATPAPPSQRLPPSDDEDGQQCSSPDPPPPPLSWVRRD
jgi:transcriptional regulator GlxA family with amidase domain